MTLAYPFNFQITLYDHVSSKTLQKAFQGEIPSNLVMQTAMTCTEHVQKISLGILSQNRVIDWDIFKEFIEKCPRCKTIDFSYCESIGTEELQKIATHLQTAQVEELELRSLPKIFEKDLLLLNSISSLKKVILQQNIRISTISDPSQFHFEVILLPTTRYEV